MVYYKNIEKHCQENTQISGRLLDEFLIYYAAHTNKLDRHMDQELVKFRHITRKFQKSWTNLLKSQYIAHRIFKKEGLIHQYLNHSAIKSLNREDRVYLEQQAACPWRFSFSMIADSPSRGFYEMLDVFTGSTFLLYSPGIVKIMQDQPVSLWFNLIGYNGFCWQSFGPIAAYQSFDPDDIFFFATERQPEIETEEDLMEDVERHPFPYMMLLAGAGYPVSVHQGNRIVNVISRYDQDSFDITTGIRQDFTVDYSGDVCCLMRKQHAEFSVLPVVYYDKKKSLDYAFGIDR